MRNASWLCAALLVALLLAGCSGKGGGANNGTPPSTSATSTSSSTSSHSSSTTPGPGGPGSIALDFTRSTPDGPVPLAMQLRVAATFKDASGNTAEAPSGVTWSVSIAPADGTATATGSTLPATPSFSIARPGDYTATATVKATGFNDGKATVLFTAKGVAPKPPIFADGAEKDGSQFTILSHYLVETTEPLCGLPADPLACMVVQREVVPPAGAPDNAYPDVKWSQDTKNVHSGAKGWWSHYPDNYRTNLTTIAFTVPASGATLSFWVFGGAENNTIPGTATGIDGLHVMVGAPGGLREVAYISGPIDGWKQYAFPLTAGSVQVNFRFDADPSCSDDGGAPPGGVLSCGKGYDKHGIWLDDILVV